MPVKRRENLPPDVEVVDVVETAVERPKKTTPLLFGLRNKRHTVKTQVRVCKRTERILDTAFAKGARHDLRAL